MAQNNVNNLQGLLRFAVEQTQSEDAPNPSIFENMDPERKEFLENALKAFTVDSVIELEKCISVIEANDSSIEEKILSLEMIEDLSTDLDLANNFLKIGGATVIIKCLDADDLRIRSAAASLIGEVTQNNPFGQKYFTDLNIIPKLLQLLSDDSPDVVRQSIHASSCLIRHYEPALAIFIENDGLENLLLCLELNDERAFTKVTFLITNLCSTLTAVRDEFIKLGAIEKLSTLVEVSEEYNSKLENLLSALFILTDSNEKGISLLKTVELKDKLISIQALQLDKPESEEIIQFTKNLLNILN